ncbi:MAG: transposase [Acidimicrobiales bacterium]
MRLRSSLVKRRTATAQRLDALVELLGPTWADVLGTGDYNKSALAVVERYADPRALKKLGRKRLTTLLIRASRGAWRESKADDLLLAADESIELWAGGGLDFEELAADIAGEVRLVRLLNAEIAAMDDRIEALYDEADPKGIVVSTPGIGVTLSAGILGRLGGPDRFANLAGVRSFTGLVPKVDQSGLENRHKGVTKAGDPGLREALYLAADLARKVDPTLAARYHRLVVDEGRHHVSAVCTLAAVLATRIAACWRRGETYVLRDTEGNEITEADGRAICAERYKVSAAVRQARRNGRRPSSSRSGRVGAVRRPRPLRRPARPPPTLLPPPSPDAPRVRHHGAVGDADRDVPALARAFDAIARAVALIGRLGLVGLLIVGVVTLSWVWIVSAVVGLVVTITVAWTVNENRPPSRRRRIWWP